MQLIDGESACPKLGLSVTQYSISRQPVDGGNLGKLVVCRFLILKNFAVLYALTRTSDRALRCGFGGCGAFI